MPYVAFQCHASFYSLVPVSFLAGAVGAPLSVAANKYLSVTAEVYSDITGTPIDVVIQKFFSFFLLMCQGAQVCGNLITSAGTVTCFSSHVRDLWWQKLLTIITLFCN
jgi:hypothetical protein